jgi:hypothetical protein
MHRGTAPLMRIRHLISLNTFTKYTFFLTELLLIKLIFWKGTYSTVCSQLGSEGSPPNTKLYSYIVQCTVLYINGLQSQKAFACYENILYITGMKPS